MPNQAASRQAPRMEILPEFQSEADALARIIALVQALAAEKTLPAIKVAYEPTRKLGDPAPEAVVRLIAEALQSAYEAGQRQ